MSGLSSLLEAQADTLSELLGDDGLRYPPALAVAAATTVGLLRATAATVRAEQDDEGDALSFADGGPTYEQRIADLVMDAYRSGHRDGWLSCLAVHGALPADPDDPATLADAGQVAPAPWDPRRLLAQTTPRPSNHTSG